MRVPRPCTAPTLSNVSAPHSPPLRILFGRLRSKGSSKFQGKASASVRSSIVLRFLGGCQAEELGMFISLLLEPLGHHAQGEGASVSQRSYFTAKGSGQFKMAPGCVSTSAT